MVAASVVVIGAGVSGLTTAVCLAEAGLDVRVDTDRLPGATTSAAAGAMWDRIRSSRATSSTSGAGGRWRS